MKIKFIPVGTCGVIDLTISESTVNGFDLSPFPEGAKFFATEETLAAGIRCVDRIDGELYITVGQCGLAYECQPMNGSHDWSGTDEWIDAADYDPDRCYIVATSAPEGAEYVKRADGWTVVVPQPNGELTP